MTPPALTRAEMDAIRQRAANARTNVWFDDELMTYPEIGEACDLLNYDIPALLAEIERLHAERLTFVERYGTHDSDCVRHPILGDWDSDAPCSCGWSEIVGRVIDMESERLNARPKP